MIGRPLREEHKLAVERETPRVGFAVPAKPDDKALRVGRPFESCVEIDLACVGERGGRQTVVRVSQQVPDVPVAPVADEQLHVLGAIGAVGTVGPAGKSQPSAVWRPGDLLFPPLRKPGERLELPTGDVEEEELRHPRLDERFGITIAGNREAPRVG